MDVMDAPIVWATGTAACLSGLSNVLAQIITAYRQGTISTIDSDYNATDTIHFILFSLMVCPPNYIWQSWLEAQFPSYTERLSSKQKEQLVDEAVTGQSTGTSTNGELRKRDNGAMTEKSTPSNPADAVAKAEKKLNLTNTAIKFSLDQTIGAAINTVLFIAGIALLRGHSFASIQQDVRTQFWPMIFAGQKLWPAVSVAQFTLVPFEYRTLVGSVVSLFWGIYLSLVSGAGK